MTRLIFCGQAPSRIGDGRPFSGPSGRRLAALLRLRDYEQLASMATLVNIFDYPADRQEARGDGFDEVEALERASVLVGKWVMADEPTVVIACGHAVYRALTGRKVEFFKGHQLSDKVEVWCFPHPSGASAFWNRRDNVMQSSNFLRRLLHRSGISIAR